MKISDHHVRSPLLNVNRSCQTCHRWPEEELRARVHATQDRTFQVRNIALDALLALISDIQTARSKGASDAALDASRQHQRRAQFLLDFIEAENSMGFHADQEAVRILALSLDESRRGQASLSGGVATPGAQTSVRPAPQEVSPGSPPDGGQR
jgi:nitrite reductase (cytochrome c-552)